jgi:hypothetical protein
MWATVLLTSVLFVAEDPPDLGDGAGLMVYMGGSQPRHMPRGVGFDGPAGAGYTSNGDQPQIANTFLRITFRSECLQNSCQRRAYA